MKRIVSLFAVVIAICCLFTACLNEGENVNAEINFVISRDKAVDVEFKVLCSEALVNNQPLFYEQQVVEIKNYLTQEGLFTTSDIEENGLKGFSATTKIDSLDALKTLDNSILGQIVMGNTSLRFSDVFNITEEKGIFGKRIVLDSKIDKLLSDEIISASETNEELLKSVEAVRNNIKISASIKYPASFFTTSSGDGAGMFKKVFNYNPDEDTVLELDSYTIGFVSVTWVIILILLIVLILLLIFKLLTLYQAKDIKINELKAKIEELKALLPQEVEESVNETIDEIVLNVEENSDELSEVFEEDETTAVIEDVVSEELPLEDDETEEELE